MKISNCKKAIIAFAAVGAAVLSAAVKAGTIVEVQTSLVNFYIEVDDQAAPIKAGNFLDYVRSGRYNNIIIHGNRWQCNPGWRLAI